MHPFLQDLRFGVRSLLKDRAITFVAILSIALGIAGMTTTFGWIDLLLLRPVPGVDRAQDLITVETLTPSHEFIDTSYLDYRDYRDRTQALAGLAIFKERPLSFGDGQGTQLIWSELVSGNFFDVLKVKPGFGRYFAPADRADIAGPNPVAVISDHFWTTHYARDPGVLGKTVRLNQRQFTIVGVANPDFIGSFPGLRFDIWVPIGTQQQLTGSSNWLENRSNRPFHLMGRLNPGVSVQQADAEMLGLAHQLNKEFPRSNEGIGAAVLPLRKVPYGPIESVTVLFLVLLAAAAVVMVIVCANVANLLLARTAGRYREFSIRMGLGASRSRIIAQMLTESVLLAFIGAVMGVTITLWLGDTVRALLPIDMPLAMAVRLDPTVVAFAVFLTLVCGLFFGTAPALQATRANLQSTLKEGGRSVSEGRRGQGLRASLVIAEVALALVAVVGAGLCYKSFQVARRTNPGFNPEHVLLFELNLSTSGYKRVQAMNFYKLLHDRIAAMPGVQAVSDAEDLPFSGGSWEDLQIEGYVPRSTENMKIYRNIVAPGYFDAMQIPMVEGRDFTEADDDKAPPAVIVSEGFVRRFLPGVDPIRKRVRVWGADAFIVGVVKDAKFRHLNTVPEAYFYMPTGQFYRPDQSMWIHVRTASTPLSLANAVQAEVHALDPSVAVFDMLPLEDYMTFGFLVQKISATLLGILGAIAVLLAALGLYSVMAYSVTQRTHEIGIRMALGAQPSDVLRMVLLKAMLLAGAGILVGIMGAIASTRLISGVLFGVSSTDPLVFILTAAFLLAVGVFATLIPARRAIRIDPLNALRYE